MDILNEVKNIVAEVCEVEISKVNNDSLMHGILLVTLRFYRRLRKNSG